MESSKKHDPTPLCQRTPARAPPHTQGRIAAPMPPPVVALEQPAGPYTSNWRRSTGDQQSAIDSQSAIVNSRSPKSAIANYLATINRRPSIGDLFCSPNLVDVAINQDLLAVGIVIDHGLVHLRRVASRRVASRRVAVHSGNERCEV